ncbi:ABC transporter ATP-binding protein/permease [Alsobacter sp. SYSU M60028]|uniref:ABC transporter ATP-binding protein/permease n=1 Tax=Alsobacter ponti TaxID=2962936 RepID=A0ABT1LF49_9HYPH|nr:ABC transporter ATP-binding protein/permease [Alsobacter ponti]MCP8940069.1 ABC transporter ATP-binding protein/permease [Alsobacter ponti]
MTHVTPPATPRRRVSADKGALVSTIQGLWPYLWPKDRADLRARILWATVLLFVAKLVTISVPFTFKWATDALVPANQHDVPIAALAAAPVALTVIYGVSRLLMALLTQWRDAMFASVAMNAVRRLALEVFEHMHRLSLRFHLEKKTGGLTRVLERGRNGIESIVRMSMLTGVPTVVEFAMILGVLLWQFDWRYCVITVVMIVAYMTYTTKATNWRIGIRRRMNESDTDANTKAVDSLLNFETVKYFGAEERETSRYDKSMERFEKASVKAYVSLAVLNAGQAAIFTAGLTACMVLVVIGIREGRHTLGDLVMINAMLIQLYQPLNFMGMVYREIKQAVTDIEQMFDILDRAPEIADKPGAKPLVVHEGAVRFEDVRFAYVPERPILKGVSFEVPAGKTVAIVGPSGAGKSTISRLLFRFYEPQSGRILIDGQPIADATQKSLRAAIGMVPQDTVLFNDTIGYNIRYGRWEATEAEVEEAAALAQIDRFIRSLPEGFATSVGERGLKLSGGEKQRVAIARTILKGPPILVLDEATSALDSFTEKDIQDALERISRGRTTLVIAHRLSTVVNADEILVLDKGVVVERGSHPDLLSRGGVYAQLWNRQREVDEARATLEGLPREEAAKETLSVASKEPAPAPAA